MWGKNEIREILLLFFYVQGMWIYKEPIHNGGLKEMVYSWERHIQRESEYAEKRCMETRRECGLPPIVEEVHCEDEPCQCVCPFKKGGV